jgi:DNA polymerase-3 subunit delta'
MNRFGDIRGHDRPAAFLRAAVANERLAHALLFVGPDGVGKRCIALALAAWLQCEQEGEDACGSCKSCRLVAAGSHPDVHVVAVASGKKEIGVDQARRLKRFTQMQPVLGKAKVAVVDQAHMLTVAAQNALLKTLEDPPDRSLLLLVANNADALLATVRSRCQRVQFLPLAEDVVRAVLVSAHGVPEETAARLATLADGSPGRALELGACLKGGGEEVLEQLAGLGTSRYVRVMELAAQLARPDGGTAAQLEVLLARYRDDAAHAAAAGGQRTAGEDEGSVSVDVHVALRRADLVRQACAALRRRNPNRALLLEALLLRLART